MWLFTRISPRTLHGNGHEWRIRPTCDTLLHRTAARTRYGLLPPHLLRHVRVGQADSHGVRKPLGIRTSCQRRSQVRIRVHGELHWRHFLQRMAGGSRKAGESRIEMRQLPLSLPLYARHISALRASRQTDSHSSGMSQVEPDVNACLP